MRGMASHSFRKELGRWSGCEMAGSPRQERSCRRQRLDPALEGTAPTSLDAAADLVDDDLGTIGHEKAPHLYGQVRGICGSGGI